jgi:16S rRNA C1402 (ribose-2'-O) methylase RsmI
VIASLLDAEPRGELVVVIEGAEARAAGLDEMVEEARRLVADGMRKREAAVAVARRGGGSANEIYGALVNGEGISG